MNKDFKNTAGFTLIETVIYIAILAFLMGGGMTAGFYIIDSGQKNKTDINTQAEGYFLLRKIEWALTGASSISVTPTSLSVTKDTITGFPSSQNPLILSLDGSNLQLTRGNPILTTANLNSSNVAGAGVGGVVFIDIPSSGGKPEGVKINFTVMSKESGVSKLFTVAKYLRK